MYGIIDAVGVMKSPTTSSPIKIVIDVHYAATANRFYGAVETDFADNVYSFGHQVSVVTAAPRTHVNILSFGAIIITSSEKKSDRQEKYSAKFFHETSLLVRQNFSNGDPDRT